MINLNTIARIPKVSVCVVTYNHEKYIGQCLQSLVDQVTDFDYEIIVGEDCSTDTTRKIIKLFSEKYPNKIRPIFHEKNIGPVKNILECYKLAKGKYIAHIDGDDVALKYKLQKQYDVLEMHSDCYICTHEMHLINKNSEILKYFFKSYKENKYSIHDLLETLPFFAHSSKMFRNDFNHHWIDNLSPQAIDIELHVKQVTNGMIYHISDALGQYRVMSGTSSNTNGVNPLLPAGTRRLFNELLNNTKDKSETRFIKYCYAKSIMNYSYQSLLQRNSNQYKSLIKESYKIKIISPTQLIMLILSLCPSIAMFLSQIRRKFHEN